VTNYREIASVRRKTCHKKEERLYYYEGDEMNTEFRFHGRRGSILRSHNGGAREEKYCWRKGKIGPSKEKKKPTKLRRKEKF